jgi:hypothetical protein
MAITLSYLTVTPTWASKKLTIDGSVAVRESVALKIVGCGTDTSVVFKLSSEDGRVDYAKFPNAVGDAWTPAGDDLTGTLNLNTDLLVAAFAALGPCDTITFVCTVASATSSNLFAIGQKAVKNWMEDADDPVAYSTPLADAIEELTTDFEEHTHNGVNSFKVAHADLVGIGANSHDAIDIALTGIAGSINTLTSGVNTNALNIAANAAAINLIDASDVKHADFAAVDALATGTTTMKLLREKINEILTILKG